MAIVSPLGNGKSAQAGDLSVPEHSLSSPSASHLEVKRFSGTHAAK